MRLSISHIDKDNFLSVYPQACMEAFKEINIRNGFIVTGLVPYNPTHVLDNMQVQFKTATLPGSYHGINTG
jgi:hypothetical protein